MRQPTWITVMTWMLVAACAVPDDDAAPVDDVPRITLGSGEQAGWARWDDATGLNASGTYVYNAGNVSVNDFGNGTYQATFQFPGTTTNTAGNVLVNAIGSGNVRCKITSWTASGTLVTANIRCHNGAGVLTKSSWVVSYARFVGGTAYSNMGAYAHMNSTIGGLNANRTWGDSITATRTAVGRYTLTFATHTLSDGNIQITSYGTNAVHCNIASIATSVLTVGCYGQTGAAADSQFTFRYTRNNADLTCPSGIHDSIQGNGGYVTYDGTTVPPAPYNLSIALNLCPPCSWTTALNTVTHPPGAPAYIFRVTYPGMGGPAMQIPLTTAIASDGKYCKTLSWGATADMVTDLQCFSPTGGTGSSSQFSQLIFQNGIVGCLW